MPPGRKPKAEPTKQVLLRLPPQMLAAVSRLKNAGFHGRSEPEVIMTLLGRELERIADRELVAKLESLGTPRATNPNQI